MIKSATTYFLAIFYGVLTMGISIGAHYCGGNLESVYMGNNGVVCCCDAMQDDASCCYNESVQLQLKVEHIAPDNHKTPDKVQLELFSFERIEVFTLHPINKSETSFIAYHAPPINEPPVYLSNQSLIFYG